MISLTANLNNDPNINRENIIILLDEVNRLAREVEALK